MAGKFTLGALGWRASYAQQLTLEDLERAFPARIAGVQRSVLTVWSEHGEADVPASMIDTTPATVGDWALIDRLSQRIERLLARQSLLARMAAGNEPRIQPIAANLDTLFVVTSCNDDFNLSRLERYLAIAHEAGIDPVVVLTRRDLCADVGALLAEVAVIAPRVPAIAIDARDTVAVSQLQPWLTPGATIACVGSSGVGKSTLINTLTGAALATGGIREHDSRGRHTTTARQMIAMPAGAWLIDTPGMRELKVGAVEEGIRVTFDDVESLAGRCRFRDCLHQGDTGCAVIAAVASGALPQRRLDNYLKLQREAKHATQSIHARRAEERRFGKMYKAVVKAQERKRGG